MLEYKNYIKHMSYIMIYIFVLQFFNTIKRHLKTGANRDSR